MAHIRYVDPESIPESERVDDEDNILRIHGCHPEVMSRHWALYRELMYGRGPLSRAQREILGLVVSAANECHY